MTLNANFVEPLKDFDWTLYEGGYTGGNKLVVNKSVKLHPKDKHTKIYSHAPYAEAMYKAFVGDADDNGAILPQVTPKDSISGTVYNIKNITPVSKTEIRIDTDNGMSSIIDMNKERQFIEMAGCKSVGFFMENLKNNRIEFPRDLTAKVVGNRISIWGAMKDKIEDEFKNELVNGPTHGYEAKVVSLGAGGFIVNIMGVECFMPKSLAAVGPISNPESYIGKTLNVCIVNYSQPTSNFVVSYKKYLEMILPEKIRTEFQVGAPVTVMVTGTLKNGLFCAIRDKAGEFITSSLLHRSTMSHDMEVSFDNHEFVNGDMFVAYIFKNSMDEKGNYRIVLSDKKPVVENESDNDETNTEA